MAQNHYEHLAPAINTFFQRLGHEVALEQHGSRGPDIVGSAGNEAIVGEIKSDAELKRDLPRYWFQWNSRDKFGGKTSDYKIAEHLPAEAAGFNTKVRGWLCVIFGQLRYYCRTQNVTEGWLVLENCKAHRAHLEIALGWLVAQGLVQTGKLEQFGEVGFVKIEYQSAEAI